jgi:hypothetical protein
VSEVPVWRACSAQAVVMSVVTAAAVLLTRFCRKPVKAPRALIT